MRRITTATRLMLGLTLAGAACSDGGTTPGIGFTLKAPATELVEGARLTIGVESGGLAVSAGDVEWSTRDAAVASVRGGVVEGVGPGVTWVIARRGAAVDSLRLTVRFGALASGSAAVRVFESNAVQDDPGIDGQRLALQGFAFVSSNLANDFRYSWIHATSRDVSSAANQESFFAGDTVLSINLSGGLEAGALGLTPTRVNTANGGFGVGGDSTVFLRIYDGLNERPDGSIKVYVAVAPAVLEITSVTMPPAPGRTPGQVSGRVAFQAAGLKLTHGPSSGGFKVEPIGTSTVQVYAEFTSPIYHRITPTLAASLTGAPYASERFFFGALGRMDGDQLVATGNGMINSMADTPTFLEVDLRIASPRAGSIALGGDTAQAKLRVDFADLLRTPGSNGGELGPKLAMTSHAGTIKVTEFRAPTETDFGWIIGEVTATLSTTPVDPARTHTFRTENFYLPIQPRLGLPYIMR